MPEKELEDKFRLAVKKVGGKAFKFTSPGNQGVPDRLVLLPGGKVGFVELKRKGEKVRPLQQKRIDELRALGFYATVLDNADDINVVLEMIPTHIPRWRL